MKFQSYRGSGSAATAITCRTSSAVSALWDAYSGTIPSMRASCWALVIAPPAYRSATARSDAWHFASASNTAALLVLSVIGGSPLGSGWASVAPFGPGAGFGVRLIEAAVRADGR